MALTAEMALKAQMAFWRSNSSQQVLRNTSVAQSYAANMAPSAAIALGSDVGVAHVESVSCEAYCMRELAC